MEMMQFTRSAGTAWNASMFLWARKNYAFLTFFSERIFLVISGAAGEIYFLLNESKPDCIYQFPIDLHRTKYRLVPNLPKNCNYDPALVQINEISLCVTGGHLLGCHNGAQVHCCQPH